jgi:putative oxidoreductase
MTHDPSRDLATTLLRLTLGTVFLAHSVYLKLVIFTLPGTAAFFASIGLPAALAYLVFLAEAAGGVALVLGVAIRPVTAVLFPIAVGATWAHWTNGWLFTNEGGGWEYPLFLAAALAVQYGLGAGAFALGGAGRYAVAAGTLSRTAS